MLRCPQSEKHRHEEATQIETEGQVVSDNVYYTKQTVGNACGTVGLIHAVANCSTTLGHDVPIGASCAAMCRCHSRCSPHSSVR